MDSSNISAKPLPPSRGFHRSDEFDPPATVRKPMPGWLVLVGSLVITFHFFAIGAHALAFRSGPWPNPLFDTPQPADAPPFARIIDEKIALHYLMPLRMTHNYHFNANATETFDVYFEVRLKDANGKVMTTLTFPEARATPWVSHRQKLLAEALFGDAPVAPPLVEKVPSPLVTIWKPVEAETTPQKAAYVLEKILEHSIPRDRPSMRPTEWSLAVSKSYVRYLCRVHGATSGELIRHSREPVPPIPTAEIIAALPQDTFVEMIANFGEYRP